MLSYSLDIKIAAKIGFSETAFVFPSNTAHFKLRFFTPLNEVDLCGHATIATFYTLLKIGKITPGNWTMETKAGLLNILVVENQKIYMQQPIPKKFGTINPAEIADSLNISINHIPAHLPVQIFSTGLKDIIVPIKSRKILEDLQANFSKIAAISKKNEAVGYHLFAEDKGKIYCRNFAPLLGIDEEAATGTASGALAGYLHHNGQLFQTNLLTFYQGFSMGKESEIEVQLTLQKNQITDIKVGGRCKNFQEMSLIL